MGVHQLDLEDDMFTELDENNDDYKIGYFQNYEDGDEGWATSGSGSDVWLIANKELYQFLENYKKEFGFVEENKNDKYLSNNDFPNLPFICQLTYGEKHFVISGEDTKEFKEDLKKYGKWIPKFKGWSFKLDDIDKVTTLLVSKGFMISIDFDTKMLSDNKKKLSKNKKDNTKQKSAKKGKNKYDAEFWGDIDTLPFTKYTFSDGKNSNKFWEYTMKKNRILTRYGKIGTEGVFSETEYDENTDMLTTLDKLVVSKEKKGYVFDLEYIGSKKESP